MAANRIYTWSHLDPNASASLLIYGYTPKQAVSYSAVVYPGFAQDVPYPLGAIDFTQGETRQHSDGSVARVVYVHNRAAFNPCTVDVLRIVEAF